MGFDSDHHHVVLFTHPTWEEVEPYSLASESLGVASCGPSRLAVEDNIGDMEAKAWSTRW